MTAATARVGSRLLLPFVCLWFSPMAGAQGGQDHEKLEAALAAAQASASRPGDESLGCAALEKELTTQANDPALRSYIEKSGAAAQEKMAAMNAAQGRTKSEAAATLFSSIMPGADMAMTLGAAAQGPGQQAQAAQGMQARMQQMNELVAVMPQLMRGQRVIELGQARNCAWAKSAAPSR
jgi:hypothetical protein